MANYSGKTGVDDMVMLSDLSNGGITSNLKKRYEKDWIYTYIGHVLISINPYKRIDFLVNERALQDYRGKQRIEMPPHVFALSDDMYRTMINEQESQCVIISGESGAGKTEASKLIMQYIANNCGKTQEVIRVRDIIMDSNPLLESFGNAKTIRNNNSSRFGKYMEIQFDRGGEPRGGRISNYLLEKSRVVYQNKDERSFHIFYMLLSGADKSLKDELRLVDAQNYHYLNQGGCFVVDDINDAQEFQEVQKAMDTMGFTSDEKLEVFRLLSAILWLGNIEFGENNEESHVTNDDCLTMFAWLIQSDVEICRKALCKRTITTGVGGRGSTYEVPQKAHEAIYSRDALAKALYSRLFDYIIDRVNKSLGWITHGELSILGILDIYGFEIFDNNGFEQLCINYVNEKLQQIFINLTLKEEQEEYAKEQIKWEPIKFFNNKICCDLIESKRNPIGILTLLDDTCNFPQGTDEKFLQKLSEHHGSHDHFHVGGQNAFVIKHYAGDVQYFVDGMCDKNRDTLYNDLINLSQCTNSRLLPILFPESRTSDDKRRPTTAGFKLKESCQSLVDALSQCHPHYIRCIKPNDKKASNTFTDDRVHHQVKYLGLLENVKVRRAGYAYRQVYDKFFYRYAICTDETWPPEKFQGRWKEGATAIVNSLGIQPTDGKSVFELGTSKIFIRAPETIFALEEVRERKTFTYANRIQRFFLKYASEYYIFQLKKKANDTLRGKKDRRRNSLERQYLGDYIQYRENFQLKGIVGRDVKVHFADVCNHIKSGKKVRRIIVISTDAIFIIELAKNKDKATKKQKPFVYMEIQRINFNELSGVTMSELADNWIILQGAPGTFDVMIENSKKTEILAMILKLKPEVPVNFTNLVMLTGKKGKKTKYAFNQDPKASMDGGVYKSKKVSVAAGAGRDAYPNLVEPPAPEKIVENPYNRSTPSQSSYQPPPSQPSYQPPSQPSYQPPPSQPSYNAPPKKGFGPPKKKMPMPKKGFGPPKKMGFGPKFGM